MAVQQLSDGRPDGFVIGRADDKGAFFGNTAINQKSRGTDAPAVDPTVSGCALLASVHSIAIGAASLANVNSAILASFGLCS